MAKYNKELFSGVGTDLFIKKLTTGHNIGEGYLIEVFTNGVKSNEIRKRSKQDVIEAVREFKSKYNTNRAFQNAQQLHITYKSREEQSQELDSMGAKDTMASLDNTLLKQASEIETLLNQLVSPDTPTKIRLAADEILNTNEMPAPNPDQKEMPMSAEGIANMLAGKILGYMSANPNVAVDEAYNHIKHWLSEVRKNIEQYEKTANQPMDRGQVVTKLKEVLFSSDPEKLKALANTDVSTDLINKTKEVLSKAASASDVKAPEFDSLEKLEGYVRGHSDNPNTVDVVEDTAAKMYPDQLKKEITKLEKTDKKDFSQALIDRVLKDLKLAEIYFDHIQTHKTAFFKYAGGMQGSHYLDKLFVQYVNANNFALEDADYLWSKIAADVNGEDAAILPDLLKFALPAVVTKTALTNMNNQESVGIAEQNPAFADDYAYAVQLADAAMKKGIDPKQDQAYVQYMSVLFQNWSAVLKELFQASIIQFAQQPDKYTDVDNLIKQIVKTEYLDKMPEVVQAVKDHLSYIASAVIDDKQNKRDAINYVISFLAQEALVKKVLGLIVQEEGQTYTLDAQRISEIEAFFNKLVGQLQEALQKNFLAKGLAAEDAVSLFDSKLGEIFPEPRDFTQYSKDDIAAFARQAYDAALNDVVL